MSGIAYFSGGAGLTMVFAALLLTLSGIGIAVWRSAKKQFFGEILVPCCLIAWSILFLVITFDFPSEEAGPSAVPRLWIFWLIVLCAGILWQIRGKEAEVKAIGRLGFLLLIALALVAYYFAMQIVGYFLSSFVFLVFLMHALSYKRKFIIICVASSWVVFSYVVFYKMLYIQLPLGWFEQYF